MTAFIIRVPNKVVDYELIDPLTLLDIRAGNMTRLKFDSFVTSLGVDTGQWSKTLSINTNETCTDIP